MSCNMTFWSCDAIGIGTDITGCQWCWCHVILFVSVSMTPDPIGVGISVTWLALCPRRPEQWICSLLGHRQMSISRSSLKYILTNSNTSASRDLNNALKSLPHCPPSSLPFEDHLPAELYWLKELYLGTAEWWMQRISPSTVTIKWPAILRCLPSIPLPT